MAARLVSSLMVTKTSSGSRAAPFPAFYGCPVRPRRCSPTTTCSSCSKFPELVRRCWCCPSSHRRFVSERPGTARDPRYFQVCRALFDLHFPACSCHTRRCDAACWWKYHFRPEKNARVRGGGGLSRNKDIIVFFHILTPQSLTKRSSPWTKNRQCVSVTSLDEPMYLMSRSLRLPHVYWKMKIKVTLQVAHRASWTYRNVCFPYLVITLVDDEYCIVT